MSHTPNRLWPFQEREILILAHRHDICNQAETLNKNILHYDKISLCFIWMFSKFNNFNTSTIQTLHR